MNHPFIQPPQVEWASGALAKGPLLRKSTRIRDLIGIFADDPARQRLAGEHVVTLRSWRPPRRKANSIRALLIFIPDASAMNIS